MPSSDRETVTESDEPLSCANPQSSNPNNSVISVTKCHILKPRLMNLLRKGDVVVNTKFMEVNIQCRPLYSRIIVNVSINTGHRNRSGHRGHGLYTF